MTCLLMTGMCCPVWEMQRNLICYLKQTKQSV